MLLFLLPVLLGAQDTISDLRLGQWRQHLPWRQSRHVTTSADKIWYATEWAVVGIDKTDRSPQFLTKVEGLSDIGMGLIRYSRKADVLLLAYSNSNIDLWRPDGSVTNLPFIKKNVSLAGDKKIYDVFFDEKFAYLSCGFGVVKLNLEREEVEYTVFTGTPVRSFTVFKGHFYAGTSEGMYRLPTDNNNPADFSQWELMDSGEGFPDDYAVRAIASFDGALFFGGDKKLQRYDGSTLQTLDTHPTYDVIYMSTEGEGLVIGWKEQFAGRVQYREKGGSTLTEIQVPCEAIRPIYCVEDGARKFWFADDLENFRFLDLATNQCEIVKYNSPATHNCTEIVIARDNVYVATPGPPSQLGPQYKRDGILVYENETWSQFNIVSHPQLADGDCYADLWRVAAHPTEDVLYAGSWVGGLVEKKDNDIKCFTKNNSPLLPPSTAGGGRTAIGGMAFDADNNLWLSNYDASKPIAVLKPDGSIVNFAGAPASGLLQPVVDLNGYKWFVVAFNGGVVVYDSGNDLNSISDDRYRLLTSANSVLPANTVTSIAVDLEGDVWVGTVQGAVSFECGSNVFDNDCKGSRRILTVDDFNGYLLETEEVKTIAIDGANRKWFGTNNGIFVMNASVDAQVAQFTATNSPLFDNVVNDMAINPKNGEVWIGTEKGIQVYRGEAVEGGKINKAKAYAYPNPVAPEYDGPIAIYGLARDANVKITDVSGHLVFEGKALGGQAVWNGRDYTGRRAASGVYTIFATSSESFDSPDAIIVKVVILN